MRILGNKEIPVWAQLLRVVAIISSLIAIVLLCLSMFEIYEVKLWIALTFVNIGLYLNLFVNAKFRDKTEK
ncbi:MAG: hypothetical protein J5517_06720 [Eubacterium sp.]|nr:hypothetical protein [Eubacterium sp.]